jgi:hypothetical protein
MAVGVEGGGDARVTKASLDLLGVGALGDQESGARVAQIVDP